MNTLKRLQEAKWRLEQLREASRRRRDPSSAPIAEDVQRSLGTMLIPLEQVQEEEGFRNIRQGMNQETFDSLKESLRTDGLRNPIIVIKGPGPLDDDCVFYLRAGFRRTRAARELGWQKIACIVLPENTPQIEGYWQNLIENCVRDSVSPYEIATQAHLMIQTFHVSYRDFCVRAGLSEQTIRNYVHYVNNVPDEILNAWKEKHPFLSMRILDELSHLTPLEALNRWRILQGETPIGFAWARDRKRLTPTITRPDAKMVERLWFAIEVNRGLERPMRDLCLAIIEFMQGSRKKIEGVFDPDKKMRMYKSRKSYELALPEGLEEAESPKEETEEDSD